MICAAPASAVVIQAAGRDDDTMAAAAGKAAKTLGLSHLQGRRCGLMVLLTDARPEPRGLHRAVSHQLEDTSTAIGIGSRAETPADFPRSFTKRIEPSISSAYRRPRRRISLRRGGRLRTRMARGADGP